MGKTAMKTTTLLLILVLLVSTTLAGCTLSDVVRPSTIALAPTPVIRPIYAVNSLTRRNATDLSEMISLRSDGSGPVVAMAFASDGSQLLSVHAGDGELRRWSLGEATAVAKWLVGPVDPGLATFDRGANLLATASTQIPGIRLWDTTTGELTLELGTDFGDDLVTALVLSPDGQLIYEGVPAGYHIWNTRTGYSIRGGSNTSKDLDTGIVSSMVPLVAASDALGEWVIVGYQDGYIDIYDFNQSSVPGNTDITINWALGNQDALPIPHPRAMAVHPTRRWLAAVVGDNLNVWDTRLYPIPFPRKYHGVGADGPANLAFSPDGSLLAVGTSGGWQIRSVPGFQVLVENDDQPVTAVAWSPDGSLFAWGDAEGTVHVWGVPQDR